MAGETLETILK